MNTRRTPEMLYRTHATALNFDLDWLTEMSSNPSNVALLTVHGPTMAPTLLDGDLVAVDPVRPCGHCYACMNGRQNVWPGRQNSYVIRKHCRSWQFVVSVIMGQMEWQRPGCFIFMDLMCWWS